MLRKCEKTQASHNRKKKELFSIRTKLSHYNIFDWTYFTKINENTRILYKEKKMIFRKALQKILKLDLILQIMN